MAMGVRLIVINYNMDPAKIYVRAARVFKGKTDSDRAAIGGPVAAGKYGNFDRSLKLYLSNCSHA